MVAVTSMLDRAVAYTFLVSLYSYTLVILTGFFTIAGLVYLRFKEEQEVVCPLELLSVGRYLVRHCVRACVRLPAVRGVCKALRGLAVRVLDPEDLVVCYPGGRALGSFLGRPLVSRAPTCDGDLRQGALGSQAAVY